MDLEVLIELINQEIEFYKSLGEDLFSDYDHGFLGGMIHIKGLIRKEKNKNV